MPDGTVLVATAEHPEDSDATAGQLARIADGIRSRGLQVRWVVGIRDADAVLRTEAGPTAAVVAWEFPPGEDGPGGATVLRRIGRRLQNLD
ncbi:hypothetical protein ABZZ74_17010 [Streptomyces sp. NPDC006476]|uniref:hypothetical protein n=1 Tax=Streptomyces sp. NPDC006476 TaxID=3157175 RepID=UPI0033B3038B